MVYIRPYNACMRQISSCIPSTMKLRTAFLVLSLVNAAVQHPEEWQLWKTQHGKSYQSQREELDRHLTWLANREYINGHNKNTDEIGFSLRLNQFGDWVWLFQAKKHKAIVVDYI